MTSPGRGIIIGGRLFYPEKCVGDREGEHHCVHDWRCHWDNFPKAENTQ